MKTPQERIDLIQKAIDLTTSATTKQSMDILHARLQEAKDDLGHSYEFKSVEEEMGYGL